MEWQDIRDPKDPELDRLAQRYSLHPLHIEDCRHRNQNAKVEEQDSYLFVVLKLIGLKPDLTLDVVDFDVFVGPDYVITVEEGDCTAVRQALDKTDIQKHQYRPDQVMYRVMDAIVDNYLPALDRLNDIIDESEDDVLTNPHPTILQHIFDLKRTLIELRRVLTNMRDVVAHLQRTDSDLIKPDLLPFLRDVYDHVARNLDIVETQRDIVNGSLEIYLSSVANRTNEVMKVLTIVGTVTLPAVIITGLFGMNVKGMPFVNAPQGFGIVAGIVVATSVFLGILLRVKHWL